MSRVKRRAFFETLENRSLLATLYWQGDDTNNLWSNLANWTTNPAANTAPAVAPTTGDILHFDTTVNNFNAGGGFGYTPNNDIAGLSNLTLNFVDAGGSDFTLSGGVAGYFSPSDKSLNFYHDYAEPEISNWVCLHECTHLLTFLIDPQYVSQIWVNEGVADYFGSADITLDPKKGKISIAPGRLQTDRVLTVQQAIIDGNDVKLEKLFTVTHLGT